MANQDWPFGNGGTGGGAGRVLGTTPRSPAGVPVNKLRHLVLGAVVVTALAPTLVTPPVAAASVGTTPIVQPVATDGQTGLCRIWPKICALRSSSTAAATPAG